MQHEKLGKEKKVLGAFEKEVCPKKISGACF